MAYVFEIIFQLLGELLLQVTFEAMVELGLHSLSGTLRKPKGPVSSTIGFALWGAIAGGISLLILPASPIAQSWLRKINLVATPVVVASFMSMTGRFRSRRKQTLVRLDRFGYAFVFAFTMALIRYVWAT